MANTDENILPNTWYEIILVPGASELLYGQGQGSISIDVFSSTNRHSVADLVNSHAAALGGSLAGYVAVSHREFEAVGTSTGTGDCGSCPPPTPEDKLKAYHEEIGECFGLKVNANHRYAQAPRHAAEEPATPPQSVPTAEAMLASERLSDVFTEALAEAGSAIMQAEALYDLGVTPELIASGKLGADRYKVAGGTDIFVRTADSMSVNAGGYMTYEWAHAEYPNRTMRLAEAYVSALVAAGALEKV